MLRTLALAVLAFFCWIFVSAWIESGLEVALQTVAIAALAPFALVAFWLYLRR